MKASLAARKLGPNDQCHCGSGKKYKKCHRDADVEARRSEATTVPDSKADRHGGLCATYNPISRKRAAVERADFLLTLRRMRTEGRTLLHVSEPGDLARDQSQLDAAFELAASNEVHLDFKLDPHPPDLELGQRLLDEFFGVGVYHVLPTGISLRRYGATWSRTRQDGDCELIWSQTDSFADVLMLAKQDEWERRGMGRIPLSLVGAAAELFQALLDQHENIARLAPDDTPASAHFGLARLIAGLLEYVDASLDTGSSEGLAVSHVASGLALGVALEQPTEWDALLIPQAPSVQEELESIRVTVLGDAQARQILAATPANWSTPAGLSVWSESLRAKLGPLGWELTASGPATGALSQTEAATSGARADHGERASPIPDLIRVDVVSTASRRAKDRERLFGTVEEAVAPLYAEGQELSTRQRKTLDEAAAKAEERAKLELALQQVLLDEQRLHREAEETTQLLRQNAQKVTAVRARALAELLERGARELGIAEQSWQKVRSDLEKSQTALEENPELSQHARLLAEYEQVVNGTGLASLPPTLRASLESSAELARLALGPLWPVVSSRSSNGTHAQLPIFIAAAYDGARVRLGLALPISGASKLSLRPGSLEAAMSRRAAEAALEVLKMLNGRLSEATVDHWWTANVSVVWVEMPARLAEGVLQEAEQLFEMTLDEALSSDETLSQAHVHCEVLRLEGDGLDQVEEGMRLARA